jgi:hypothetical protein
VHEGQIIGNAGYTTTAMFWLLLSGGTLRIEPSPCSNLHSSYFGRSIWTFTSILDFHFGLPLPFWTSILAISRFGSQGCMSHT